MGAGSAILGGAGAGGAAGFVGGMMDDPDQVQYQDTTSTTDMKNRLVLDPRSQDQQQLQDQSLQSYLQQLALAQQYEQGLAGAQGYQDLARQQAMGILGGQSFAATPEEQALIEQQRASQVGQASADVNRLLDERLSQISSSAAARGVRGQALSQLQGDALRGAADQYGAATRQAAAQAAQAQLQMPYQRIAAQSPYLQQGVSFADQMRLQAQQNRQAAQNPFLLQMLQQERLATGEQRQYGTQRTQGMTMTPGQQGSFGRGLLGAIQGGGSGAATGANVYQSVAGANYLNRQK